MFSHPNKHRVCLSKKKVDISFDGIPVSLTRRLCDILMNKEWALYRFPFLWPWPHCFLNRTSIKLLVYSSIFVFHSIGHLLIKFLSLLGLCGGNQLSSRLVSCVCFLGLLCQSPRLSICFSKIVLISCVNPSFFCLEGLCICAIWQLLILLLLTGFGWAPSRISRKAVEACTEQPWVWLFPEGEGGGKLGHCRWALPGSQVLSPSQSLFPSSLLFLDLTDFSFFQNYPRTPQIMYSYLWIGFLLTSSLPPLPS